MKRQTLVILPVRVFCSEFNVPLAPATHVMGFEAILDTVAVLNNFVVRAFLTSSGFVCTEVADRVPVVRRLLLLAEYWQMAEERMDVARRALEKDSTQISNDMKNYWISFIAREKYREVW